MKTLIAVPTPGHVKTGTVNSLFSLRAVGDVHLATTEGSVIHDSRELLANTAVEGGYDRILWIDSDMQFAPGFMERLAGDMNGGTEFVSGLYFKRVYPTEPTIYRSLYPGDDTADGGAAAYTDYPKDALFEIAACGFGAVLMTTALYSRVRARFRHPFQPMPGIGEDLSFCWRAAQAGEKLWCDSRARLDHIGKALFGEAEYEDR